MPINVGSLLVRCQAPSAILQRCAFNGSCCRLLALCRWGLADHRVVAVQCFAHGAFQRLSVMDGHECFSVKTARNVLVASSLISAPNVDGIFQGTRPGRRCQTHEWRPRRRLHLPVSLFAWRSAVRPDERP